MGFKGGRHPGPDQEGNGHLRKLYRLPAPFKRSLCRLWSGSAQRHILGNGEHITEGTKMELIVRDTGGSPEKALAELETLVNTEKVAGVIGPLSSKTATVVSQKAQELGVPIVTLTQRSDIVETGDMVFRNFLTPAQEIDSLVQMATVQLGLKRFGILYPDNTYGRFCMNLFWDRLDEMGGSVTAVEAYPPDGTDFADQIKKMVGLYYPRGANWRSIYFKKQLRVKKNPKKNQNMTIRWSSMRSLFPIATSAWP
jgi:branched-chain amino acid transport system substrate-binding protein